MPPTIIGLIVGVIVFIIIIVIIVKKKVDNKTKYDFPTCAPGCINSDGTLIKGAEYHLYGDRCVEASVTGISKATLDSIDQLLTDPTSVSNIKSCHPSESSVFYYSPSNTGVTGLKAWYDPSRYSTVKAIAATPSAQTALQSALAATDKQVSTVSDGYGYQYLKNIADGTTGSPLLASEAYVDYVATHTADPTGLNDVYSNYDGQSRLFMSDNAIGSKNTIVLDRTIVNYYTTTPAAGSNAKLTSGHSFTFFIVANIKLNRRDTSDTSSIIASDLFTIFGNKGSDTMIPVVNMLVYKKMEEKKLTFKPGTYLNKNRLLMGGVANADVPFIMTVKCNETSINTYYNDTLFNVVSFGIDDPSDVSAGITTKIDSVSVIALNMSGSAYKDLVGEILLYDRVLDVDECAKIQRYLKIKWHV